MSWNNKKEIATYKRSDLQTAACIAPDGHPQQLKPRIRMNVCFNYCFGLLHSMPVIMK